MKHEHHLCKLNFYCRLCLLWWLIQVTVWANLSNTFYFKATLFVTALSYILYKYLLSNFCFFFRPNQPKTRNVFIFFIIFRSPAATIFTWGWNKLKGHHFRTEENIFFAMTDQLKVLGVAALLWGVERVAHTWCYFPEKLFRRGEGPKLTNKTGVLNLV